MNTYNNGHSIVKHGNNGKRCVYTSNGVRAISEPPTHKQVISFGDVVMVVVALVVFVTVLVVVVL